MNSRKYSPLHYIFFTYLLIVIPGCGKETNDASGELHKHIRQAASFDELFSHDPAVIELYYANRRDELLMERISNIYTLSDETIIVADAQANKIYRINPDGEILNEFGESGQGPGEFSRLGNVRVGNNDLIYALDTRQWRLTLFSKDVTKQKSIPVEPGTFLFIPDNDATIITYLSNRWRKGDKMLTRIDLQTGDEIGSFGYPPPVLEEFGMPISGIVGGLMFDDDGILYRTHSAQYGIYQYENDSLRAFYEFDPPYYTKLKPPGQFPEIPHFTLVDDNLFILDDIISFSLREPSGEPGRMDLYLEFISKSGEYINGGIEMPDGYELKFVDNEGNFYFSYQPPPEIDGTLPNQKIKILNLS